MAFDTPILFLVFNRPETTARVFEKIRELKPQRLFFAADGPRKGKDGEKEKCQAVRDLVLKNIDWQCETSVLLRDHNLGCGKAVSGAITWFFENVEEGIILEDDTLPDLTFFNFCKVLLDKYRNEKSIWQIGGICHFPPSTQYSYYFSAYSHIWGWATWKRAWNLYDYHLANINYEKLSESLDQYFNEREKKYWLDLFRSYAPLEQKPTWDYQWAYCMWYHQGLSILPTVNMISNIGFGETATNTKDHSVAYANKKTYQIRDIIHNPIIKQDENADKRTSKYIFGIYSPLYIIYLKFKRRFSILLRKNNKYGVYR